MALIKGRFIDPTEAINLDIDPIAPNHVARKSYIDTKSENEAAAALSAAKEYTDTVVRSADQAPYKESKILNATDIANGYVDLTREAMPKSMIVSISGTVQYEDEDYTMTTVDNITRITFTGDLAPGVGDSGVIEGDKIYFQYWAPLEN